MHTSISNNPRFTHHSIIFIASSFIHSNISPSNIVRLEFLHFHYSSFSIYLFFSQWIVHTSLILPVEAVIYNLLSSVMPNLWMRNIDGIVVFWKALMKNLISSYGIYPTIPWLLVRKGDWIVRCFESIGWVWEQFLLRTVIVERRWLPQTLVRIINLFILLII